MNTALALDFATLAKAVRELDNFKGTSHLWVPGIAHSSLELQERFIEWLDQFGEDVEKLEHIKALASDDFALLNKFLTDNGFPEMFRGRGGHGAVAILDMLVKWAFEADDHKMYGQIGDDHVAWKAFKFKASVVKIFKIPGQQHPMAQLQTTDGGSVCVIMTDKPANGLDLFDLARQCTTKSHERLYEYDSVMMPNVSIDTHADVAWLLGLTNADIEGCRIDEAFQILRIEMDVTGASAKVASGIASRGVIGGFSTNLVFKHPFAGWFLQPGSNIPIAPFYADESTWVRAS